MHHDEVDVDEALARRLIDAQFPGYADAPLRIVEPWGTDHAIWRLGDDHVVRFPRIGWAAGQPELEARWLPWLSGRLPVEVPTPVGLGSPAFGYPFRWGVHRWLDGHPATPDGVDDAVAFARSLVEVVHTLRELPVDDAPPAHNRARPSAARDRSARAAIESAREFVDVGAALTVWDAALAAAPHVGPPAWVHGDLDGNCLLRDGRLTGLLDWGSACAGDPAVDIATMWSPLFTAESRAVFVDALEVDNATLARSRGVALEQACAALPYYLHSYPGIVARARHQLGELGVAH